MGVRTLDADHWLQHDDRRTLDLLEKDLLTARDRARMFVSRPGSDDAAAEVLTMVDANLRDNGLSVRAVGDHPLETAGLSVQEDLCLMEWIDEQWILTAGSVCFPTRWDLPSKLGCSLGEIHEPVPGYEAQLGPQVERFFDRMTPGALAHRLNWSLVGSSARRLEATARQAPAAFPSDPGSGLFVRIERQTLRRLVGRTAIVFGIRIHVWPLVDVAAELPSAVFAREMESMPIDVARYKNLDGMRSELAAWLRGWEGDPEG